MTRLLPLRSGLSHHKTVGYRPLYALRPQWRIFALCVLFPGLVFGLITLPVDAYAQKSRPLILSRQVLDSLALPAKDPGLLLFESSEIDLGDLLSDSLSVETRFLGWNKSDRQLSVAGVTTSCSCLSANANRSQLPPGEFIEIFARFRPEGRIGKFSQQIKLLSPKGELLSVLTVKGNVTDPDALPGYPVRMGGLRLSRAVVKVALDADGKPLELEYRIACANASTSSLAPSVDSGRLPSWLIFACEPAVLQPSQQGDIVLTLDAGNKNFPERFALQLSGISPKHIRKSDAFEKRNGKNDENEEYFAHSGCSGSCIDLVFLPERPFVVR